MEKLTEEQLKKAQLESDLKALQVRGLTESEAQTFIDLLKKIKPTEEDTTAFDTEMEEGVPFEGGMGFTEALTGLIICRE